MSRYLDKLVSGINNTVSNELIGKAQIKLQLQEQDRKKKLLFGNLGELVYNLKLEGQIEIENCNEIFDEIELIIKTISELKQKLQVSENTALSNENNAEGLACECGYTNAENDNFCRKCGKALK